MRLNARAQYKHTNARAHNPREVLDLARRLDTMLSGIEDHEQKKKLK
jgi:hypothetical protein